MCITLVKEKIGLHPIEFGESGNLNQYLVIESDQHALI